MSNKSKLYQLIANLVSIKHTLSESDFIMIDDEAEVDVLLSDILDILLNYTIGVSD